MSEVYLMQVNDIHRKIAMDLVCTVTARNVESAVFEHRCATKYFLMTGVYVRPDHVGEAVRDAMKQPLSSFYRD